MGELDGTLMLGEISTDTVVLAPELFVTADEKAIGYKGGWYYRACDSYVFEKSDGSKTFCVLPCGHSAHVDHRDADGRRVNRLGYIETLDDQIRNDVRSLLRLTGLDEEEIFNALNALVYAGYKIEKVTPRG